jgi:hypothetical protein
MNRRIYTTKIILMEGLYKGIPLRVRVRLGLGLDGMIIFASTKIIIKLLEDTQTIYFINKRSFAV